MAEQMDILIQEYRGGKITRREFIQRAVAVTGSLAAAASVVDSLRASPAYAAQVDPDDPALVSAMVEFAGPAGAVYGYRSEPKASGIYPAIVVIHGNSGMSGYLQDVVRRLAKEGFVGLGVDYLSRKGGTVKVKATGGIESISALAPPETVKEDTQAAVAYLRTLKEVRGDRIGIMGFCWGGGQAFYNATQLSGLRAVVVFYGRAPNPLDLVQQIEARVLAHYGELDPRITGQVPQVEAAMKKYNKPFEYKIYPKARHAFHSDENPTSYNPEAAREAWTRTLEFFKQQLQG